MEDPKAYTFRKREIILIFLLLLVGGAVIFSLGIKIGQSLISNNGLKPTKEEVKLSNIYETEQNYDDNKMPEKTVAKTTNDAVVEEKTDKVTALSIKEITDDIKGKFTIQISSHQSEDEAKKAASELYKSGYKLAYYMEAEVPGKGTWYRVGIGFFKQKNSAETFAEMLKKQGKIASYLIRKID